MELDILEEEFQCYLRVGRALEKTLKRPQDRECCKKLLKHCESLNASGDMTTKRNTNNFMKYFLKVINWTSSHQPNQLYNMWVLDYTQYFMDLQLANTMGEPNWLPEYNLTHYYALSEISAISLHNFVDRFTNGDSSWFTKYYRANTVRYQTDQCEGVCMLNHYCAITRVDYKEFRQCLEKEQSALHSHAAPLTLHGGCPLLVLVCALVVSCCEALGALLPKLIARMRVQQQLQQRQQRQPKQQQQQQKQQQLLQHQQHKQQQRRPQKQMRQIKFDAPTLTLTALLLAALLMLHNALRRARCTGKMWQQQLAAVYATKLRRQRQQQQQKQQKQKNTSIKTHNFDMQHGTAATMHTHATKRVDEMVVVAVMVMLQPAFPKLNALFFVASGTMAAYNATAKANSNKMRCARITQKLQLQQQQLEQQQRLLRHIGAHTRTNAAFSVAYNCGVAQNGVQQQRNDNSGHSNCDMTPHQRRICQQAEAYVFYIIYFAGSRSELVESAHNAFGMQAIPPATAPAPAKTSAPAAATATTAATTTTAASATLMENAEYATTAVTTTSSSNSSSNNNNSTMNAHCLALIIESALRRPKPQQLISVTH